MPQAPEANGFAARVAVDPRNQLAILDIQKQERETADKV